MVLERLRIVSKIYILVKTVKTSERGEKETRLKVYPVDESTQDVT